MTLDASLSSNARRIKRSVSIRGVSPGRATSDMAHVTAGQKRQKTDDDEDADEHEKQRAYEFERAERGCEEPAHLRRAAAREGAGPVARVVVHLRATSRRPSSSLYRTRWRRCRAGAGR